MSAGADRTGPGTPPLTEATPSDTPSGGAFGAEYNNYLGDRACIRTCGICGDEYDRDDSDAKDPDKFCEQECERIDEHDKRVKATLDMLIECPHCEERYNADERVAHELVCPARPLGNISKEEVEEEAHRQGVREAAKKLRAEADGEEAEPTISLRAGLLTRDRLADLPKPDWMIDRILTRHAYAVLAGRRSTYKSFLALDWGLSLATARPWQGRTSQRARVLYVVGEGAYGLEQRVAAWEQAWGIDVDPDWFVVYPAAINLFKGGRVGELVQIVGEDQYGLVIFDTLRRMSSGADANHERDMGLVVDRLDRVKRATDNGSVLMVAHTDKGNNGTRGSSAIEDDADIVWRTEVDEGLLKLSCSKMKDAPDGAVLDLQAKPSHGSIIIEAGTDTGQPSTESQIRLLDALRFSFPGGAHGGKLLAASGLPERTYYRVVAELVRAGHLVNTGTKHRPFYEVTQRITAT